MSAAGTVSYTWTNEPLSVNAGGAIRRVVIDWTSNSSGNAEPQTTNLLELYGTILACETKPSGTAAPTDDYDIVLNDEFGRDVLNGGGANRDTANTEAFVPQLLGSDGTTVFPAALAGQYTPSISNAGDTKSGKLILVLR